MRGLMTVTVWALTGLVMAGALAGCTKRAAWDETVVGPDLDTDGPWGSAADVIIDGPARGGGKDMRITITRRPGAPGLALDDARLENVLSDTKDYMAGVTYRAFTPVIAETNAERRDYWIVGMNASRTKDRSVYTLLRFPHDLKIAPGLSSDAFDYVALDCSDLNLARSGSYVSEDSNGKPVGKPVKLEQAPPPEAGDCEFNSLKEAMAVTPAVLRDYDLIKNEADAPHLSWQSVHVEVK